MNALELQDALKTFGVSVMVEKCESLPSLDVFALRLFGLSTQKVVKRLGDAAQALGQKNLSHEVRLGDSRLFVLSPRIDRQVVKWQPPKRDGLGLYLGEAKQSLYADLTKLPHLLIGGMTGSGKSNQIQNFLKGFYHTYSPQDLQFVLIDPKQVELDLHQNTPYCSHYTSDARQAVDVLEHLCELMEQRYKSLTAAGVRDITNYNAKGNEQMPRVVVIIDEFADLMLTAKEAEVHVQRLAQKARAVGIHVILGTQRFSVDCITGTIKAQFSARLTFAVPTTTDSRVMIDGDGAEKLIGYGDGLFKLYNEQTRFQAPFVSDAEIEAGINHAKSQAATQKLCIATFQSPSHEAWIIQAQSLAAHEGYLTSQTLAIALGVHQNTANKRIQELINLGIVGKYDQRRKYFPFLGGGNAKAA